VLHAAVTWNQGTPIDPITGTVSFFADGAPIGSAPVDSSGVATLDAPTLPAGLHSITAAYSGDTDEYQSSTSPGALPQRIAQANPLVTLTAPASASAGSPGAFLVTISQSDAAGVDPGGQVTVFSGGLSIATEALDASGHASFSTQLLPGGADMLTASYSGDTDFAAATTASAQMITVVPQIMVANAIATVPSSGTTNLLFPVTLSAASANPVSVSYTTVDGSAAAGVDYVPTSGVLTFAPGQTTLNVAVPVIGRSNWLADLTVSLALSSPSNATFASDTATGTIQSTDAAPTGGLVPDELDPNQNDLVIEGAAGNDTILVRPTKQSGQVQVVVNKAIVATEIGIARVIVYGGAGNDRITADPRLRIGVIFFGGDGNDILTGGAGNDILIGGNGNNTLNGAGGMNLLIGGAGVNTLKGSALGDILVGGATPFDAGQLSDLYKLQTIFSVWTNGDSYANRTTQISSAMELGWHLNSALVTGVSTQQHFTSTNPRDWLIKPAVSALPPTSPRRQKLR
jgi:Ca2+-binding RTX toxin-like protein